MTLQDSTSRADYIGDGNTSVYPTTFKFTDEEEIAVYQRDLSDVETLLTLGVDYTVSGAGQESGGDVTLLAGNLPSGFKLAILRNVPATQQTDYVEMDNFPAESHEDALDKLTMLVQQILEVLDRTNVATVTGDLLGKILPSDSNDVAQYDGNGDIEASGSQISDFAVKNQVGIWTKQQVIQEVSLSYGDPVIWDLDTAPCASLILAGNPTINAPLNMKSGGRYNILIQQSGSGDNFITWDSVFLWDGNILPILTGGINKRTIFSFYCNGTNMFGGVYWRES